MDEEYIKGVIKKIVDSKDERHLTPSAAVMREIMSSRTQSGVMFKSL